MKKTIITIGIASAALIVWLAIVNPYQPPAAGREQPVPTPEEQTNDPSTYVSDEYGIAFRFSPDFFLLEKEAGTAEAPQYSITLAEDTQENRDLFAGRASDAREGPPTITIDISQNRLKLTAQEWIESSTTWTLSDGRTTPILVNNLQGLNFSWAGLYEGTSTVFATDHFIYVVSATWFDETSRTFSEYQNIINSLGIQGASASDPQGSHEEN